MSWVVSASGDWAELAAIQEGLQSSASRLRVTGATDPVKALVVAALARALGRPVVVMARSAEHAERLHDHIVALCAEDAAGSADGTQVSLLPSLEMLLYEDVTPDLDVVGQRLHCLRRLLEGEPGIFVASAPALLQRCIPPHVLRSGFIGLKVGDTVDRDELALKLVERGYVRQEMVDSAGDFSVRGGVIDVHPAGANAPVRIDLFGDEVESIRTFDATTQRSTSEIARVTIPPAREILLSEASVTEAVARIEAALDEQTRLLREDGKEPESERIGEHVAHVVEAVREGAYVKGLEYLLPFFHPEPITALDYLPEESIVFLDEPKRTAEQYGEFLQDLLELQLARLGQGLLLPLPEPLHISLDDAQPALDRHALVELALFSGERKTTRGTQIDLSCQPMEEFAGDMERMAVELRHWQERGARVLVATRQVDRLAELLDEVGVGGMIREHSAAPEPGQIVLSHRPLNEGFRLPAAGLAVLTDREIFGWRRVRRPVRRRAAEGVPIGALTDLRPDDYVVHINHGVGIYRGLVRRGPEDAEREYLLIEYADSDRLYVPTEQFDRVQKYLGGGDEGPQIHRLGGSEWERAKRRARRSAQDLAGQLIKLYAARQHRTGHAFHPDTPWQREMEDGFMYEETPDQLAAIEAVKQDLEAPLPMDRLVCGDVGYGKTEVAIRAAFKVVMESKQVAILVPTTVLAQQHYSTFKERLVPYPVHIEMLSRFRSRKEQQKVVADLKSGAVDIVIGTHRLLSKDIEFKDLALLVVDEEQRFGVRHKEKLKQLRTTVDVLTMTATPIPRTLNMSLAGIRDMSVMNDPPEGRTATITRAVEREDGVVREAILRELERGGQVYVVHNRVESIGHVADHVRRLVPHARVVVGHGQMNERQLERAMLQFYAGEAHILVCTTIIENGLDIPNANTLIVTDADRLGLAQLYQLRGRVGRSSRQAYAYLMWTPFKQLTDAAEKRIAAIREFSELSSGLKIALRDLEIRGAGNLLGAEQHGFIAAIGFELYMQMLGDAVKQAKGESPEPRPQISVDIPVRAYLPEEYAPGLNERIDLYRRLAAAPDYESLDSIAEEIIDRLGRPLPPPAEALVRLARLKIRCAAAGVRSISTEGNLASLLLSEDRRLTPAMTRRLRMSLPASTRIWLALLNHDRVVVSLRKADTEAMFSRLEVTLDAMAELPLDEEARRHQRREGLMARE